MLISRGTYLLTHTVFAWFYFGISKEEPCWLFFQVRSLSGGFIPTITSVTFLEAVNLFWGGLKTASA